MQDLLQKLKEIRDHTEKAALIAELILSELSEEVMVAAQRCIILHWFDQSILDILLQDTDLSKLDKRGVYRQIALLPFIDTLPWGLAFQSSTRNGLLRSYALTQPETLRLAAKLAASAYEAQKDDEKHIAEAFFCYIVAGDSSSSTKLMIDLLERINTHNSFLTIDTLVGLQEEAQNLPFVDFLPLNEQKGQVTSKDSLQAGSPAQATTVAPLALNRDKDHLEIIALLHLYLDRELSADEMAMVQQHLSECPDCEARFHFDMEVKRLIHESCIKEREPAHLRKAVLRLARTPVGEVVTLDPELEMEIKADLYPGLIDKTQQTG